MRVTFHQPAEEHERYTRHAFDGIIGQSAPFTAAGREQGQATVVAVEVDEDGRGATWTVDVPDQANPIAAFSGSTMSFMTPEIPERWWE